MASSGRGYGSMNSPGPGRGGWSVKENPAPVPKKGSSLPLTSLSKTEGKVSRLKSSQNAMENNKGKL